MTTATTTTTPLSQLFSEYDEFKGIEFSDGERVFYDGDMDPLKRWAEEQREAAMQQVAATAHRQAA